MSQRNIDDDEAFAQLYLYVKHKVTNDGKGKPIHSSRVVGEEAMKCKKCGNEGTFIFHEEGDLCKLCGKLHPRLVPTLKRKDEEFFTAVELKKALEDEEHTSTIPEDFRTKTYEIEETATTTSTFNFGDRFPSYEELKKALEDERRAHKKLQYEYVALWGLIEGENKQ